MVKDGALGKKAGRGFYEYAGGDRGKPTRWATCRRPRKPFGRENHQVS